MRILKRTEGQGSTASSMAIDATVWSRRVLLVGAFGGVGAIVANALGRPLPVHANHAGFVLLGHDNVGAGTTGVESTTEGNSLLAIKTTGIGHALVGRVEDFNSSYAATVGDAEGPGPGVYGVNRLTGDGIVGEAERAGNGVRGKSALGRGGRFSGKKAQIRLDPSTATTHPNSGAKGDLFVDSSARLWFCRGGTTWVRLA